LAQIFADCKKQCSKQLFYDFGLRKLTNVIKAAGKTWTIQRGKTTEGQVLCEMLRLFIGAGLTFEDSIKFDSILKSHFEFEPSEMSSTIEAYINAAGGYTYSH